MDADLANLHRIYRESVNRLETYTKRVAENRDVIAASEFARWLNFSGIPELLKAFATSEPLKVDGSFLQWKIDALIEACNDRFRTNGTGCNFPKTDLESLHEKLARVVANVDLMAGQVSHLTDAVKASAQVSQDKSVSHFSTSRFVSAGAGEPLAVGAAGPPAGGSPSLSLINNCNEVPFNKSAATLL